MEMQFTFGSGDGVQAGVDEAGRGCLLGPVFVAAVVWPRNKTSGLAAFIKDSKKLSAKKREELRYYIEAEAVDFSVSSVPNEEIDSINILNATMKGMHLALDGLLNVDHIDHILVDGDRFISYTNKAGLHVPHTCIIGGDNKYVSIAAASILAKVYHDEWIRDLLCRHPSMSIYSLHKNQGYGVKTHIDAIHAHGISSYHRKSFRCCAGHQLINDP